MINENFIYLGFFLNSIGSVSYIVDIIKGVVKPNRVTYSLWGLAAMITFASQVSQNVGIFQSSLSFVVGFWPLMVLVASFSNKKAYWKITKFDIACGAFSLAGLILWMVTKVGNLAIIFAILADILASFPTIKKSYTNPETETIWPYLSGAIFAGLVILTIKNWNFETYSYPIYILTMNIILTTLIKFDFKKLLKK
jgi:hypothetical protein